MSKKGKKGRQHKQQGSDWQQELGRIAKEKFGHKIEPAQSKAKVKSIGESVMNHRGNIQNPAKAPYNFIPLSNIEYGS